MVAYAAPAVPVLWVCWIAFWVISARRSERTTVRDNAPGFWAYRIAIVGAGVLLLMPRWEGQFVHAFFLEPNSLLIAIGTAMTVIGLLFSVWARLHLGERWTGRVALHDNHELIQTGPYGLVRHPIYTGTLFAYLGSALALGEWRCLVGLGLLVVALLFKLRREERMMSERFPDAYGAYRNKVAALIPLVL